MKRINVKVPRNAAEIRCPNCGKLLAKGTNLSGGAELMFRCRDNKCRFHKTDLRIVFY